MAPEDDNGSAGLAEELAGELPQDSVEADQDQPESPAAEMDPDDVAGMMGDIASENGVAAGGPAEPADPLAHLKGFSKWAKYAPWGDHVTPPPIKKADTLAGCVEQQYRNLDEGLAMKELYKLATIDQDIHYSYYKMWVGESNRLFRSAVLLKARLARLQAQEASKAPLEAETSTDEEPAEGEETQAPE